MNTKCETCGKELKENQDRFCSRKCFFDSSKKFVEQTCAQCGKKFLVKPWELSNPKRIKKFCSRECYFKSKIGTRRDDLRRRVVKNCVVCGKEFETGGRAGNLNRDFCSDECRYKGRYRHGEVSKELDLQHASYLAGLVDGEGSIFLYGRNEVACLRLTIANTKIKVLEWVKEITGVGSIVVTRQQQVSYKHSTAYHWQVNSEGAESVIKQIRPYLIIKQVQADLALETQARLRDPALKADRTWQSEYRERMKALNRRGPD